MADITSITPKPRIKCYVGDNKLCNKNSYTIAKRTLEEIGNLPDIDWLWSEESAHCICTHHGLYHYTIRDKSHFVVSTHCHGDNELCNCEEFRSAQRLRKEIEEEVN
jgi:hypothetical protein